MQQLVFKDNMQDRKASLYVCENNPSHTENHFRGLTKMAVGGSFLCHTKRRLSASPSPSVNVRTKPSQQEERHPASRVPLLVFFIHVRALGRRGILRKISISHICSSPCLATNSCPLVSRPVEYAKTCILFYP